MSKLEQGQVLAARYTLVRRLAARDATELWQARDGASGEAKLLKLAVPARTDSDAARQRLLHGARIQLGLRHANLVACEQIDAGPLAFAVFPFFAQGDLSGLRGRPWREILPVLAGIAAGIEALHQQQLVHGDLKPANVLLSDDGRPLVTDFGIATPIGDRSVGAAGSPFSSSPQQLAGQPASVADDVYGFGALAYELLSGYPPFYPDPSPERVSLERPAPLAARTSVPAGLARLVMSCLEKDPAARPRDFSMLSRELAALEFEPAEPAEGSPGRRVALQPPQEPAPTIEPQWRRKDSRDPSPEDLRRQGFRRGLVAAVFAFLLVAAGFVFLALPRWVERQAPVAATAAEPPGAKEPTAAAEAGDDQEPEAQRDLQALAAAKARYDELWPGVGERLTALEKRGAPRWGPEPFASAKEQLERAEADAGELRYDAAVAALERAGASLDALDGLAGTRLAEALAAGRAALGAGDAGEAKAQFELALLIEPSSSAGRRGLERAGSLDEVRGLVAEARALERDGRGNEAAERYRQALRLDADTSDAREGLARIEAAASAEAFSRAVAQGLEALQRSDPAAARSAFERAERIRPGSPEAREGLAAVDRALGQSAIETHLAAARQAESTERWQEALAEYRKALGVDPRLLAAQQGLERTEPRAQLAAELEAYLSRPERLFSNEVRNAARHALRQAGSVAPQGPVLARQVAELDALISAAQTPVKIALTSDNATEVTVYRVGSLGVFERKDLELLPGRYTVVGSRAGFRDVRREITLLPGSPPASVVIRCEEPI
jgi:hypothetical protein